MTEPNSQQPLALWGGAECTINRIGDGYRDQCELSGHSARADDLDRFAGLGIEALRYPLLWESFASARQPDRLWAWHDERLARLRSLRIRPILGLLHHGSGPSATSLLAGDFSDGLARHADAAAQRYPWVRDWTPVNEPLTTARFSALYGLWYPHLRSEPAFWLALLNQIDGIRLSMAAIRRHAPAARLIQTEDLGTTHSTPELAPQAEFDNLRRWASWDLLAGTMTPAHPLWSRLAGMGFAAQLETMAASPCIPDVLGLNHYLTSDRYLDHRLDRHPASSHGACPLGPLADVEAVRAVEHPPGLEGAIRACWDRYRLPIALTEVHNGCTREEQMRWLSEVWQTASTLRAEGTQVEAVTAWSLLGSHDWNSLLTRNVGHYESGVFDIRARRPRETALAPLLRTLAAGQTPDHPVMARAGWWRGHARRSHPGRPLLITGATGTLGQAFAGACAQRGIDHVLTRRDELDLRDPASMTRALDRYAPWAAINCAGWVRVDDAERDAPGCMAANFTGNVDLAQACEQRAVHYTCFSSDLVFDGLSARAYVESDDTAPLGVYGLSKAKADTAVQAAHERALIVRTASFFSPYDHHNFAVHLASALREGRPFPAADDCVTSPTYVPDLVRTVLDLIIDDERGLWHLANDGAVSWAQFAVELGGALRLGTRLVDPLPASAMGWIAGRPRHAPITSERGLIMPSLESAIERFAQELA